MQYRKTGILPVKRLLRSSLALYKKFWLAFFLIALLTIVAWKLWRILAIPALIVGLGITVVSTGNIYSAVGNGVLFAILILLFSVAVFFVLGVTETTALVLVLKNSGARKIDPQRIIPELKKLIIPMIYISVLIYLFIMLGLFALIVPGLILGFLLQFSAFCAILAGKKGLAALSGSIHIIGSNFFPVLVRSLVIWGFAIIMHLFLRKMLFASIISQTIITPFVITYHYLLYRNLTSK